MYPYFKLPPTYKVTNQFFKELVDELLGESTKPENSNEDFKIELELAGVNKDDIKISYNEPGFNIKVNTDKKVVNRTYILGKDNYDIEATRLSYIDGLLSIAVPHKKKEEAKAATREFKL